ESSDPHPSVVGQQVTLTGTVSAVLSGIGTPTGSISFLADGVVLGTSMVNSNGVAGLYVSSPDAGAHTLTPGYNCRTHFGYILSDPLTQTVTPADMTMSVVSNNAHPGYSSVITFTATLTAVAPGAGAPAGSLVHFFSDGTEI